MRDLHKMKEKFEVSLDSSHIVSLTIFGLVVVGGVFMLGVMVGKRLSSNEKTAHSNYVWGVGPGKPNPIK